MAPAKASSADTETPTFTPEVRVDGNGDYVLGFEKDGAFVPITGKLGVHVDAVVSKHAANSGGGA